MKSAPAELFGKLAVRADADARIGTGHVMRCLALAQAWQDRGGSVTWISSRLPPALLERLKAENIVISHDEDIAADFLVVDGYHIQPEQRLALRQPGRIMLAVDDLADSDLSAADVILNHNAYATSDRYPGRRSLCGSRFTLLRREFRESHASTPGQRVVLITMGGSDPRNDTLQVLETLRDIPGIHRLVLAGAANPHVESLRGFADTEIVVNPADVPSVMRRASVAITAAGSTCWELAALGVPMLLRAIADNQRGIADHLVSQNAARLFDADVLRAWLDEPSVALEFSNRARSLVDGRGADRVAMHLACHPLALRRATMQDALVLFEWANDPATRAASFNQTAIEWETHVAWLERRLASPHTAFFIAMNDDRPVGTLRFERDEHDVAEISLTVAPQERGNGFAAKMIALGSFTVLDEGFCQEVRGWVKAENTPSMRAFARAGFHEQQRAEQHGVPSVEFAIRLATAAS